MKKKVAILGDSYSTFDGYNPYNYEPFYSFRTGFSRTDVNDVNDTWWFPLIEELKGTLVLNSSCNGSAISYNGFGDNAKEMSFIKRFDSDFSHINPDVIFVFGGINDYMNHTPIGLTKFNYWQEPDLVMFAPSLTLLCQKLTNNFKKAKIYFIIHDELTGLYLITIKQILKHYGIKFILLSNIDKVDFHPTKLGMNQIKEQILNQIKGK